MATSACGQRPRQIADLNFHVGRGRGQFVREFLQSRIWQNHFCLRARQFFLNQFQRIQHQRQMPFQFARPAAGQQENLRLLVGDGHDFRFAARKSQIVIRKSSNHRMSDKFHAQLRHALRIPILLKRENAQEQIVIRRQQPGAARTRRPDLRRNELDDFRVPFRKRIVRGRIP